MKIILTQDVRGQGKKGELIEVSDGYARNFILPKKLGVIADNKAMNEMRNSEASKKFKIETETNEAKALAEKLQGIVVKLTATAGADGRLYGSVTSKEIAETLEKNFGISIDKRKISLDSPIKAFGTYALDVRLYTGVTGKINVVVTEA